MNRNLLLLALISVGFVAVVIGLYLALVRSSSPPSPVLIHGQIQDLGKIPIGKSELVVVVENPGDQDASILGLYGSCGPRSCISFVDSAPMVVPKHSRVELKCVIEAGASGEILNHGRIWILDHEYRDVRIEVRGLCVAEDLPR